MIPAWSQTAKMAKPVFFQQWNDIDVYIEDTRNSTKKVFRLLLERCLKGVYRVAEVFPLGGRKTVVDAAMKDQMDDGRRRVYIIDGDLEFVSNLSQPVCKRLFRLPSYCIENVLIDEQAIVEVLYEEDSIAEREELRRSFDFANWTLEIEGLLVELFVDYAICKEFCPEEQTVAYKVSQLVGSSRGVIDTNKLNTRRKHIQSCITLKIGAEQYLERRETIVRLLKERDVCNISIVSGKDYLLPLLHIRMKSTIHLRVTNDALALRLARHCDVSQLNQIYEFCTTAAATIRDGDVGRASVSV